MSEEQKPKEKTREATIERMEAVMASSGLELRTLPWNDAQGRPVVVATVQDDGAPPVISPFKLKPEPKPKEMPKNAGFFAIHEAGPLTSETLRRLERESGGALVLIDEGLIGLDVSVAVEEGYDLGDEDDGCD